MNKARILLFVIVLFALRFLVGVSSGFIDDGTRSAWQTGIFLVFDALVVLAVFFSLGRVQPTLPYMHLIAIVLLAELLALSMSVALFGRVHLPSSWALDYFVLVVFSLSGTAIGLRSRRDRSASNSVSRG